MAGRDFRVVGGDSGSAFRTRDEIAKRTPASDRKKKSTIEEKSLKDELLQKEGMLSENEMADYTRDSKYLPSESDKLYYLSLSNSEKAIYIGTKKQEYIDDFGNGKDLAKNRSVHAAEIKAGMSKDEVVKLWGRPAKIQIAGNPKFQNELWHFNEDGTVKNVYFEDGKVNGWALDL
jgi:hypothetical protein